MARDRTDDGQEHGLQRKRKQTAPTVVWTLGSYDHA